jgi:site-specific recombinase
MGEPARSVMSEPALAAEIAACLAPRKFDAREAEALAQCLQALRAADGLTQRLDAWERLINWLRSVPLASAVDEAGMLAEPALARWSMLFAVGDSSQVVAGLLKSAFAETLRESESANLFGSAGLPGGRGFFAELSGRLLRKLLPQPGDEHDLARLLQRLFHNRRQIERFARLPPEVFDRLVALVGSADADVLQGLRAGFADGLRLLAVRVQAEGLAANMRERYAPPSIAQAPFYRIAADADAVASQWQSTGEVSASAMALRESILACRKAMDEVARKLDTQGVSVDMVYALDVLDRCLARMDLMLAIVQGAPGAERNAGIHQLLALLMVATHNDRSLRHLTAVNLQMLQRKIVERTGRSGEHYIAWTRAEYWHIWLAAAGGGMLTVFTAAMKLAIGGTQLPLFVSGLLQGLNYAASFLLLQALGLILATKQPAMTAAALASIMREHRGSERLDLIVTTTVQIVRSQLAAALANVIVVSLGAYAFSTLWQLAAGAPFIDAAKAQQVVETLSPVTSLTIWYAALTGVILWAASVIGGWFDNWAVLHRLPRAIAEHRLGARVGRARMVRLAGSVSRNISGWGTNISLGLMLGLVPAVGAFLGLPLDVRHVTLNTGILSIATAAMGERWYGGFLLWAIAGIGTMFVLNLGVSFVLSLYTAARAFGLPRTFLLDFARALARRFRRTPGQFFLPPGSEKLPPG